MDMNQKTVKDLMTQRERMYIPTYQRRYSWNKEHVYRLLQDIMVVIDNLNDVDYKHYIGTVYLQDKHRRNWEVIDGQQRITTITLLVQAIIKYIDDSDNGNNQKKLLWEFQYLIDEDTGLYKLELSYDDELDFKAIRDSGDTTGDSNVKINYRFIYKWLDSEFLEKYDDLELIIKALNRLKVIEVTLFERDNAQEIFDGINATGKPLDLGTQVKNYLLMGLPKDEQDDLYMNNWRQVELELGTSNNFYTFLTMYLTIKNEAQIKKKMTAYGRFIYYKNKFKLSNREFIEDINYYFGLRDMIYHSNFENKKIKGVMKRLVSAMGTSSDSFGYMLQVIDYWKQNNIDDNELLRTLHILEGYLVRRTLYDGYSGTRSYYNYLHKSTKELIGLELGGGIATYSKALSRVLNNNIDFKTPSDSDIRLKVETVNLYKQTNLTKLLLERIENAEQKEQIDVYGNISYTIEHIMPQTLSDEWKNNLGERDLEKYGVYLNTLGNLTLTGYNSEYSNKLFKDKLNGKNGLKSSRFKKLNESVIINDNWNIETIKYRTFVLADILMELYPYRM